MESEVMKIAMSQGIWAVLSISLLFYILRTQEKRDEKQEEREKNYQEIIGKITDKLSIVEDVKKDVVDIKQYVIGNR
ncbi:BhlA/UviB family holin-like peptide [Clostridium sp.]|uniref:BhlA/UviB family holin-like peptide n=1 Tax=Clostridium sp. TaxID=1506 RepID=UPI003216BC5C